MSGTNDRALQGLVFDQLGLPGVTLQVQRRETDLVFRIRYPIRLNNPKRGPMLTTEYRMTHGVLKTPMDIMHELPSIVELSHVMAFTEVIRREMDWPAGWPVPTPLQIERVLTAPAKSWEMN
jgi:hypothetical protein